MEVKRCRPFFFPGLVVPILSLQRRSLSLRDSDSIDGRVLSHGRSEKPLLVTSNNIRKLVTPPFPPLPDGPPLPRFRSAVVPQTLLSFFIATDSSTWVPPLCMLNCETPPSLFSTFRPTFRLVHLPTPNRTNLTLSSFLREMSSGAVGRLLPFSPGEERVSSPGACFSPAFLLAHSPLPLSPRFKAVLSPSPRREDPFPPPCCCPACRMVIVFSAPVRLPLLRFYFELGKKVLLFFLVAQCVCL